MIYFRSSTKLLENLLQTREVGTLVSKLSLKHACGFHIWVLGLFMRLLQQEKSILISAYSRVIIAELDLKEMKGKEQQLLHCQTFFQNGAFQNILR